MLLQKVASRMLPELLSLAAKAKRQSLLKAAATFRRMKASRTSIVKTRTARLWRQEDRSARMATVQEAIGRMGVVAEDVAAGLAGVVVAVDVAPVVAEIVAAAVEAAEIAVIAKEQIL